MSKPPAAHKLVERWDLRRLEDYMLDRFPNDMIQSIAQQIYDICLHARQAPVSCLGIVPAVMKYRP